MNPILCQIFKVILNISERKHTGKIDKPTIRIETSQGDDYIISCLLDYVYFIYKMIAI